MLIERCTQGCPRRLERMAEQAIESGEGDIRSPKRTALWIGLATIVALLVGLFFAGSWLYRTLYSPSAFVTHYLTLLHEGRAADALALPGVSTVGSSSSELTPGASPALLRNAALSPLENIEIVEERREGDTYVVTASYQAGFLDGQSTFRVASDGYTLLRPNWRFVQSPIAQLDVRIAGSQQFRVNNFDLDRLQIDPNDSAEQPMQLLVFTPGLYVISVDTDIAYTDGMAFFSDVPEHATRIDMQADATEKFTSAVQQQVNTVLDNCVQKAVLLPANCPYGRVETNILLDVPHWSVLEYPTVTLEARADEWLIKPMNGAVHLYAPIQLLHDGTETTIDEDVLFDWAGIVQVQPDGTASIRLGPPPEFGF